MQEGIKNIIFDLGNVILDIDIPRTERKFRALLGLEFDAAWEYLNQRDVFHQFEKGEISEESFIWAIQKASKGKLLPNQVIDAWNGMLLRTPPVRFEMLDRLRKNYRTFIFSNTNSIHLTWVYRYLKREHNITDFDERFFERSYYSHLIGMRKPDVEPFRFILQDAGLQAGETLFIDDNEDNIKGAQEAGLVTIHHTIGAEVADVLKDF